MEEKGLERSSRSGSCIPASSPLHTRGAWKKNGLGNGRAAVQLQLAAIQGDVRRAVAAGEGLCV